MKRELAAALLLTGIVFLVAALNLLPL